MKKILEFFWIICLLIFSASRLQAQETEIKDTISSLNLYIFQLESKNLDIRNKTIINSIPQVIYTNVKHITRKTLSSKEISGMQNYLFNQKKKEYEKNLLDLYNK